MSNSTYSAVSMVTYKDKAYGTPESLLDIPQYLSFTAVSSDTFRLFAVKRGCIEEGNALAKTAITRFRFRTAHLQNEAAIGIGKGLCQPTRADMSPRAQAAVDIVIKRGRHVHGYHLRSSPVYLRQLSNYVRVGAVVLEPLIEQRDCLRESAATTKGSGVIRNVSVRPPVFIHQLPCLGDQGV